MKQIDAQQKNIFNALAEGILIIDRDEKVVFANHAYRNFLKMSEEELIGRRLRDFRPHAQLPAVMESGMPRLHAQRLEGLEEAYFVNMYPLKDAGEIIGGISVITFLSEAEKARNELDKYEAQVKQQLLLQANRRAAAYTFDHIVAADQRSVETKELAKKIAMTDMTVLLQAESGTGKEMFAQSIHNYSQRRDKVFIGVNCANFNSNMLESELFGYVEGAFTGAKKGGKIGMMEAAKGGTLFLDEIAEMDISLQAKLLRALQERKIRPVGSVTEKEIDVRIICACNVDLEEKINEGTFRKDLFYRLNTSVIQILPLRERKKDIPAIVYAIIEEIKQKHHKNLFISNEAMECLVQHDWPGNVRELRNVLEFSAYMCDGNTIVKASLPNNLVRGAAAGDDGKLADRVKRFEQEEIERALLQYGHTLEGKKKAAAELGISLATLYNKLGNDSKKLESGSNNLE